MDKVHDFKNNEVNKKLLKLFSGKRILFVENDFTMNNSVGNFWLWCRENKIEHNCLYDLEKLPLEYILEQIRWFDVVAFETRWVYDISRTLHKELSASKDKKIILECYINEPTWWRKPKVVHDVYVLESWDEDMDDWKFNKLRKEKAIWED